MAIAAAARAVSAGSVVALPTDTLYGIGADAFNPAAVTSLLAAKGRGRDMPVPVLVGSWHTIDGLVSAVSGQARDLVEAFWPGALTLVVEHAPSLAWDLGDARGTVAIRMPLHPVALELLAETGPMAVSSANITSMPPAVTAQQAYEQLGESVGGLSRRRRGPGRPSVDDRGPDRIDAGAVAPGRGAGGAVARGARRAGSAELTGACWRRRERSPVG